MPLFPIVLEWSKETPSAGIVRVTFTARDGDGIVRKQWSEEFKVDESATNILNSGLIGVRAGIAAAFSADDLPAAGSVSLNLEDTI